MVELKYNIVDSVIGSIFDKNCLVNKVCVTPNKTTATKNRNPILFLGIFNRPSNTRYTPTITVIIPNILINDKDSLNIGTANTATRRILAD